MRSPPGSAHLRRRARAGLSLGLAVLACSSSLILAAPAHALCATERPVFYVEFDDGSAELDRSAAQAFLTFILPFMKPGQTVDSYLVIASGDIAEGEDWAASTQEEKTLDQDLGRARAQAVSEMIRRQPFAPRPETITARVRDNRQIFTEADLAKTPTLTPQTRAGVAATVRSREASDPQRPAPAC